MSTLVAALTSLAPLADKVPSEDQIGTGWMYLVLFVLLAAAVTFLGFSMTKHLRKVRTTVPDPAGRRREAAAGDRDTAGAAYGTRPITIATTTTGEA